MSSITRNINNTAAAAVSSSNADNEMTLLMLQLRTLQQAKRNSTSTLASPSHITSTNNNSNDNVAKQPPVSRSSQVGIGSNIPRLLQRRRQYREQEGGGTQRLLRTDLVKLMDEALSISTEITMVVPNEPAIGSNKHY